MHCLEDADLVAELRDRGVALDVCPTSNVGLGLYPDLAMHPLPRMIDSGLNVTISTDDPPMFNTTLTDEYTAIANAYAFGADDLEQLVLNGVRATLLPEAERTGMEAQFRSAFAKLRTVHGV